MFQHPSQYPPEILLGRNIPHAKRGPRTVHKVSLCFFITHSNYSIPKLYPQQKPNNSPSFVRQQKALTRTVSSGDSPVPPSQATCASLDPGVSSTSPAHAVTVKSDEGGFFLGIVVLNSTRSQLVLATIGSWDSGW